MMKMNIDNSEHILYDNVKSNNVYKSTVVLYEGIELLTLMRQQLLCIS